MTLQEHYDKSGKIIIHGIENGYHLISFEEDGEVFRFPNKEVKEFFNKFKSQDELEHDARMEEVSMMVDTEMLYRLDQAKVGILYYSILAVLMIPLSYWTVSNSKPYGLIFFGIIMLLAIWRIRCNRLERKVIMRYFERRKDWCCYD